MLCVPGVSFLLPAVGTKGRDATVPLTDGDLAELIPEWILQLECRILGYMQFSRLGATIMRASSSDYFRWASKYP